MSRVNLVDITKVFPVRNEVSKAVDCLNLDIEDGEFLTLVGPSGCGKTTTLRMIAGLERPTSGRILFGDRDVTHLPPQKRNLSMVFQNYAIFPHMTVGQNVGYGLRLAKVAKAERDKRVREAAALVGIDHLLDRQPRQLSGGQRQRVAVARAIARSPGLILLDEPLSNLDAKLRDQTRAELKSLHSRLRNTMIYVTHDQLEALTLSDRIAVINLGKVQQLGTPHEVYHYPANMFVARFVGSPTINLFPAKLNGGGEGFSLPMLGGAAVPLPAGQASSSLSRASGRDVTLGIRPQHVSVHHEPAPDRIGAQVRVVEPIGSESIVHLGVGAESAVAVVPEGIALRDGDMVHLGWSPDRVHLFDSGSGTALYHGRRFTETNPAPLVGRARGSPVPEPVG